MLRRMIQWKDTSFSYHQFDCCDALSVGCLSRVINLWSRLLRVLANRFLNRYNSCTYNCIGGRGLQVGRGLGSQGACRRRSRPLGGGTRGALMQFLRWLRNYIGVVRWHHAVDLGRGKQQWRGVEAIRRVKRRPWRRKSGQVAVQKWGCEGSRCWRRPSRSDASGEAFGVVWEASGGSGEGVGTGEASMVSHGWGR